MNFQPPTAAPKSRKLADYKDRLLLIRPKKWEGRISAHPKDGQDPHYTVIMSTVLVLDDQASDGQAIKLYDVAISMSKVKAQIEDIVGTGDWTGGRLCRETEGQYPAYYLNRDITEEDHARVKAALSSFRERPVVDTFQPEDVDDNAGSPEETESPF